MRKRAGTTCKECADDFMRCRRASGEFSNKTDETYDWFFNVACRHIGYTDVTQVTCSTIEKMYSDMRLRETLSGKPTSETYLNQMHKTIRLLFDELTKDDILVKNQ